MKSPQWKRTELTPRFNDARKTAEQKLRQQLAVHKAQHKLFVRSFYAELKDVHKRLKALERIAAKKKS